MFYNMLYTVPTIACSPLCPRLCSLVYLELCPHYVPYYVASNMSIIMLPIMSHMVFYHFSFTISAQLSLSLASSCYYDSDATNSAVVILIPITCSCHYNNNPEAQLTLNICVPSYSTTCPDQLSYM